MNRLLASMSPKGSVKRVLTMLAALSFLVGATVLFAPSKVNAAACTAPSQDFGTATTTVSISNTATYRIWSRIMAPDTTNNSYLLEVDGNTCYVVGDSPITANTWTWVDYQNANSTSKIEQSLTAGNHTLKLIGREAGVKIARLLLLSDLNCAPQTATGDECTVAGDTEVPAVTVTAPAANTTVNGTVNVTATATDNVSVTKVEFYVNGVLKSTDTTAPYAYSWNSATVPNGQASLMAKAYDAAGNTGSDAVQVTVSNGDTQAPTIPTGVTATSSSTGTQVTVKWTASTDNIAVIGYWVSRNGVTVGQVTTGAQYVDNNVLPGNTYSYRVSAYDAAGNTSGLSSTATVTTPVPPTPDTTPPSTPASLQATAVSKSQINLGWSASTDNVGVAGYDVYRAVGSGTAGKVATVSTTSYGDTGLAPSTTYTYYVVARDSAGNVSGNSPTATAKTLAKKGRQATIRGTVTLSGKTAQAHSTLAANGTEHDIALIANQSINASVTINVDRTKRIIDADSSGRYLIDDLPGGTYRIRYSAPGYYNKIVTVKVKTDRAKTQNVKLRKR